jgi:tRNA (adenine37-N6)-methyltransferase
MNSIGIIHSPYSTLENMPIQSAGAQQTEGYIELNLEFIEGLKDLDKFSHIFAIYKFHKSEGYKLTVTPFLDNVPKGLFATRAPKRPNPIGLSVYKILEIKENIIKITGVDVLDGTPLLDIKPYVKKFDVIENPKCGWLEDRMQKSENTKSDKRFK